MSEKLSYEGFKHVVESRVKKSLGDSICITTGSVTKNNDVVKEALFLKLNDNCASPCLYFNDLYSLYIMGESIETIIDDVIELFSSLKQSPMIGVDKIGEFIEDFTSVKPLIEGRLVNAKNNNKRLEKMPHRKLGEFAIYYLIKVSDGGKGFFSAAISEDMMKIWGVEEDKLYDIAIKNMNLPETFVLRSLDDYMNLHKKSNMFILTNKYAMNGAIAIISHDVREKVASYLNGDYYILPSSVNELIIMKKDDTVDIDGLKRTVREVNRSNAVSQEEFLSDNVYEYNRNEKTICLC